MPTKFATVFVTVGTTEFNALVSLISSHDALKVLRSRGFNRLLIQVGKGASPPASSVPGIEIESFTLKPSTYDDIKSATLIISHAGSGSILDALDQNKPLVTVVNPDLMDNHQTDLALHLHRLQHLAYCTLGTLLETLQNLDLHSFRPFPPGMPHKFGEYLDQALGLR